VSVVVGGEPLAAEARVEGRQAHVTLPATGARELKLWAHSVTSAGDSEPLEGLAEIAQNGAVRRMELGPPGMVTLPYDGGPCEIRVEVQQ